MVKIERPSIRKLHRDDKKLDLDLENGRRYRHRTNERSFLWQNSLSARAALASINIEPRPSLGTSYS
jgi:hypothetical protein